MTGIGNPDTLIKDILSDGVFRLFSSRRSYQETHYQKKRQKKSLKVEIYDLSRSSSKFGCDLGRSGRPCGYIPVIIYYTKLRLIVEVGASNQIVL
jgi:hypothetical protein